MPQTRDSTRRIVGCNVSKKKPNRASKSTMAPAKQNDRATRGRKSVKKPANSQAVPAMLRDLLPHNEGPNIGVEEQLLPSSDDERTTRNVTAVRRRKMTNEPSPQRKSLNVRRMLREQLAGELGPGVIDQLANKARSDIRTPNLISLTARFSEQLQENESFRDWVTWERQKKILDKYLMLEGYILTNGLQFMLDENEVAVVKPTTDQYDNFAELLKGVEIYSGRIHGVVRIIVPRERGVHHDLPLRLSREMYIPVSKGTLQKDDLAKRKGIHHIEEEEKVGKVKASFFKDKIQEREAMLRKKYDLKMNNVKLWRELARWESFQEEHKPSFSDGKDDGLHVSDENATYILRAALECNDPGLTFLPGNVLRESQSIEQGDWHFEKIPGITIPVFHLSLSTGTVFPLQLSDFGAYTLNYHHGGAPRLYTVIPPKDHALVEKLFCLTADPDAPQVPTCSQHISHEQSYIPKETLQKHSINFKEVEQLEGEIIIFFPWAYHQGYNMGPNITEELAYASERWKVFHRKNLWKPCNKNCDEGDETFDLRFASHVPETDNLESEDEDQVEDADVVPNLVQRVDFIDLEEEEDEDDEMYVDTRDIDKEDYKYCYPSKTKARFVLRDKDDDGDSVMAG